MLLTSRNLLLLLVIALLLCCQGQTTRQQFQAASNVAVDRDPERRELPKILYGITSESVADRKQVPKLRKSLEVLRESGKQPILRAVYQWSGSATKGLEDYCAGVNALKDVAYIMVEIIDSSSMSKCDVDCYRERTRQLVKRLGDSVDIWEIGNEINENWLREHKDARDKETVDRESLNVLKKLDAAAREVSNIKGRTALTLYFNDDGRRHCWTLAQDEMFQWVDRYLSSPYKSDLNYVLISYYDDPSKDDGCRNNDDEEKLQPDWPKVFSDLDSKFNGPSVGFGECGTKDKKLKTEYIHHYYSDINQQSIHAKFMGGYFWWFFDKDMVPFDRKVNGVNLLQVLKTTINKQP